MFKIKLIKIEVDKQTFKIDLKKMKQAITRNTIMVFFFLKIVIIQIIGSCPNYPHGIVDPLEEMAFIAKSKKILFHVDCCLGEFFNKFDSF